MLLPYLESATALSNIDDLEIKRSSVFVGWQKLTSST